MASEPLSCEGTPTVAVLIPCLNEEQAIGKVVRSFNETLPTATIYVYDNNSTDATAAVACSAGALVRRAPLSGKGNVVRQMFAEVEADIYLLVDGDDTYDATIAARMVELVVLDGYDLVQARRVPVDREAYRRGHVLGNSALNRLARLLFGRTVPDMLSGYLAMSRRFVKSFPCEATGFEIEAEITAGALEIGLPVGELACEYRKRAEGSMSKLASFGDGLRILATMLRFARQGRPLLFFGLIAFVLAAFSIALGIPILITFLQIHKVPHLPRAILATGLVLLSALSFMSGLILDTVTRGRREARRLRYLSLEGPLALQRSYIAAKMQMEYANRLPSETAPRGSMNQQST